MRLSDVFVKFGNEWQVRDVVTVPKDKMKGKRHGSDIRLNSDAKHVLREYGKTLNGMPLDAPLFVGCKSLRRRKFKAITRQTAWLALKTLAEKALGTTEGIGTHTMRKSFATHLYLKTRDIYRVKDVLGHAFVTTTENYIKYGLQMMDDSIETLGLS